eukprot:6661028-Lingulodinium_polyedra.AAC.1
MPNAGGPRPTAAALPQPQGPRANAGPETGPRPMAAPGRASSDRPRAAWGRDLARGWPLARPPT